MPKTVSKSEFKPPALAYLREIEDTGEPLVLTDRGRPVLRITPYAPTEETRAALEGCIVRYDAVLERAFDDGEFGVSAISVWEAAMLVKKGRLVLALPLDEFVARCETLPGLRFLPATPRIALASVSFEPMHADPAGRLIAATAPAHQAVLVTKDKRLHGLARLDSTW